MLYRRTAPPYFGGLAAAARRGVQSNSGACTRSWRATPFSKTAQGKEENYRIAKKA